MKLFLNKQMLDFEWRSEQVQSSRTVSANTDFDSLENPSQNFRIRWKLASDLIL